MAAVRLEHAGAHKEMALSGGAISERFFQYQASTAKGVALKAYTDLYNRVSTDIEGGFTRAAKQINALEAVGPALEGKTQASLKLAQAYLAKAAKAAGPIALSQASADAGVV